MLKVVLEESRLMVPSSAADAVSFWIRIIVVGINKINTACFSNGGRTFICDSFDTVAVAIIEIVILVRCSLLLVVGCPSQVTGHRRL